jgi:phytoene dehydrogenase-like protein
VLAGRIHVGPSLDYLEHAFDHVKYGRMSSAPWLDITIPSILDDTLAPAGAHVASIYVHYAPHRLRTSTWEPARDTLLANTLGALEAVAPDIGSLVVAAEVITPSDLEADLGLAGGHIFHGELALDQLFTMRPLLGHSRYDMPLAGLYLCGAGTHPGGFLMGTSGRLAAQVVLSHARP